VTQIHGSCLIMTFVHPLFTQVAAVTPTIDRIQEWRLSGGTVILKKFSS